MQRRAFLMAAVTATAAAGMSGTAEAALPVTAEREAWTHLLGKIALPVLTRLAEGRLQKTMPVEISPIWDGRNKRVTYLECFGRLISGLAPWLSLPSDDSAEGRLRRQITDLALKSYAQSVDPNGPDYMLWRGEGQALVDSAYYSNAFLRAPKQLWEPLDKKTKDRVIAELKGLRRVVPPYSNWLLFSAMNEAFLLAIGEEYDPERLQFAIRKTLEWYVGDGWYSDGPSFHFDYYNSYVIQPMLVEILEVLVKTNPYLQLPPAKEMHAQALKRMQRYGEHLERVVAADGSFSPHGRSSTYRTAVFQPLALLAWRKALPASLPEGRIRALISAVHARVLAVPSNFSKDGFLTLGFAGHQPGLADRYSNNGSMYITTESFLALGLPPTDSFWTAKADDWTAKRAFSGQAFARDYAVEY